MHGRLFEIREKRLDRDEWITEGSFYNEETGSWCDWMMVSESREEDLEWLKSALPASIFKVEGDEIEIISDGKEFVEEWIEELKKKVNSLTYEKAMSFSGLYQIKSSLSNMLHNDFMFYSDYNENAHNPTGFIQDCLCHYQGKKLYVCGIIDYHF